MKARDAATVYCACQRSSWRVGAYMCLYSLVAGVGTDVPCSASMIGPAGCVPEPSTTQQAAAAAAMHQLLPDVSSPFSTASEAVVKPQGCRAHQLALASSKGGLLLPANLPESLAAIWCRKRCQ